MTDQEQAPPTLLNNLFGWYAMVIVGLGMRTGLLDALLEVPETPTRSHDVLAWTPATPSSGCAA
jgi:hypothetical protein